MRLTVICLLFLLLEPLAIRAWGLQATHHCNVQCKRTAEACALYSADHGRYPASLADLVPAYLDRVPDCQTTYLHTEHDFIVCCLAPGHRRLGKIPVWRL